MANNPTTRREALRGLGNGFGVMAFAGMLGRSLNAGTAPVLDYPQRIKRGIFPEQRTGELMKSPFKFNKFGKCGMDVSELGPHLGEVADDICWVRSVFTDIPNHQPSRPMMNTGANQAGRPSMGAWLTYGLGTENQDLPGYVALCPAATDDFGFKAIEKPIHVHDIHATILYLFGIDHTKLTYRYSCRDFRLTDVSGNVLHHLLA